MKNLLRPFSLLLMLFLIFFVGCPEDNPVSEPPSGPSNTLVLTTSQSGTLTVDGYSMTISAGTVPKLQNGSDGTVTFSIETKSTLDSGIANLPSGYTLVGKYVRFGPDGFVFALPIQMSFPGGNEPSAQNLVVLRYYPEQNKWYRVPTSYIDTVNKLIISEGEGLKLGLFALTKYATTDFLDPTSPGCFQLYGHPGCWYTLTVQNYTLKFPNQAQEYPGGTLIGFTFSNGTSPVEAPIHPLRGILPQGTYSFWVTKRCQGDPPGYIQTYNQPVTVNINSPLEMWGWGNFTNCYGIQAPPITGGNWVNGPPQNWPPPTVPMGTGKFQATLTWVNTSSSNVDLDLWLTLPNNEKVYYNHKISNDSCFALDRDMTHELGNCVENIYSLKNNLPSGTYKVEVNYFSGNGPKSYNVRILLNGTVTNHSGTLSNGTALIRTFTL